LPRCYVNLGYGATVISRRETNIHGI